MQIVQDRHDVILKQAEQKKLPEFRLNVEVIEAHELKPMDSNGLSDPFVTMHVTSNPKHSLSTSVKSGTLNPMWAEHFSLPLNDYPSDENLVLQIWYVQTNSVV